MGFWSSLATIGTSLIPGVGPVLAPMVGAGLGALEGRSRSGTSASTTGQVNDTALLPADAQTALARSRNNPALKSAENYYTRALGGDRQSLEELLGPEIKTVLSQYDTAAQTAAELNPRGGGRTQTMAELPFEKVATYGKALMGARSGAADKLAEIGSGEAGRESAITQSLIGAKAGQNRLQFEKDQVRNENLGKIGSSIGDILVGLIGKKKPKASSTVGGFGDFSGLLSNQGAYGPNNPVYKG